MQSEKTPTGQSTKPFEPLSDQQKQQFLQEVKLALEDDQRLRQQAPQLLPLREKYPLESSLPRRPSVEEQRLMLLAGLKSLEDLELLMSSPLNGEWLAQQNSEDRKALDEWYDNLEFQEKS